MRLRCRFSVFPSMLVAVLAVLALLTGVRLMAQGDSKDKGNESSKSVGAFGESRRGDVPEGTMEMLTPDTDKAIQSGLAWLAHSQNADGSFGTGTYRGNIAVTSLAGLAFMSGGSSPGRGPHGAQIDKALSYVMENTSPSGFIAVAS
ncbi:MAG: prenyltransferase, partial [Isosphaeraceae bacterium]